MTHKRYLRGDPDMPFSTDVAEAQSLLKQYISPTHEMTNLIAASEHAAGRDALHGRLIGWMNDTRDPFRGLRWHRRPWRRDAPPATWHYSQGNRHRGIERGEKPLLSYDTGLPTPPVESDAGSRNPHPLKAGPTGDEAWVRSTAAALRLDHTLRSEGRPRKLPPSDSDRKKS